VLWSSLNQYVVSPTMCRLFPLVTVNIEDNGDNTRFGYFI
jgi:hypothetical protein